jgi:hypothetical protein
MHSGRYECLGFLFSVVVTLTCLPRSICTGATPADSRTFLRTLDPYNLAP